MRLANVVVHADDAALEDRKVVLDRVGVPELSADILFDAVVDATVSGELFGDRRFSEP